MQVMLNLDYGSSDTLYLDWGGGGAIPLSTATCTLQEAVGRI